MQLILFNLALVEYFTTFPLHEEIVSSHLLVLEVSQIRRLSLFKDAMIPGTVGIETPSEFAECVSILLVRNCT